MIRRLIITGNGTLSPVLPYGLSIEFTASLASNDEHTRFAWLRDVNSALTVVREPGDTWGLEWCGRRLITGESWQVVQNVYNAARGDSALLPTECEELAQSVLP